MTPHPMWLHALTRKNMGSASEIDVEMTVEYVATPTTSCATPLTSSVEYSGSSWSEKVDEKASARGRVAEEGTTVTFPPVHLRCVALPVDVPVTPPTTPTTSSASSSDEPKNVRDI